MSFPSILFAATGPVTAAPVAEEPAYFADLNLDQVIASVTGGRKDYDLTPFFHARLRGVEEVCYRHEVFRDLQDEVLSGQVTLFAERMRLMRGQLAQAAHLRHRYQKASWLMEAAHTYCDAVPALVQALEAGPLGSRALRSLRAYLVDYTRSDAFTALVADTRRIRELLASARYCLTLTGGRVKVSVYDEQDDYGADVLASFEKFKQTEAKDYRVAFHDFVDMNHVEEAVLDRVALLYPQVFSALGAYGESHRGYLDPAVGTFDREVQFYLAYLDFAAPLKEAGLVFCYPTVSGTSKEVRGREVFDLALADKLVREGTPVVPNGFQMDGVERILVVSGPNQGGKTTFARTFGQLHHLAALGCPVPGRQARLFLCDELFTHFERGENLKDLSGKLQDDLVRVHTILERATADSIVIMNEVFTSTTLGDAIVLGTRVLQKIIAKDVLCVCVTFVDELSRLGPSTVSMISTVVPGNPAERTYRIVRKPADGLSYALAIADKHGLTYERLAARLNARIEGRTVS